LNDFHLKGIQNPPNQIKFESPTTSKTLIFLEQLIGSKKRTSFLVVCLFALLVLFVKKSFIEDETAAFEFMADRPEGSWLRLRSIFQYLSIPMVYAWKFLVVGFVVWVGCFTMGYRVTFEQCWRAVTASEVVCLLPELVKIVYFMAIETDPDFYRIQNFYPLSAVGLFNPDTLPEQFRYPLKSINLFEILYIYSLASSLTLITGRAQKDMFRVLLITYLPILMVWLVFWMIVYR